MVDAFDCSHAVLRAAYDISEGNVERWLMMLQDRWDSLSAWCAGVVSGMFGHSYK